MWTPPNCTGQIPLISRFLSAVVLLASATSQAFTGSEACKDCHAEAYENWLGSHHDLAMQLPGSDTVLGDFDDAEFTYNGVTTRFFQRDGQYLCAMSSVSIRCNSTCCPCPAVACRH